MAGEQGTGKHPHKSAAEPFEHHEASTTKSESKGKTEHAPAKHEAASHKSESESGDQGTGKHPHKSAADPKEHHETAGKK
ncbi:MAG: hypothetical protein ACRYFU_05025 [Janthinobacterium lividum]